MPNWEGLTITILTHVAQHPEDLQLGVILLQAIHADIQDAYKALHANKAS